MEKVSCEEEASFVGRGVLVGEESFREEMFFLIYCIVKFLTWYIMKVAQSCGQFGSSANTILIINDNN